MMNKFNYKLRIRGYKLLGLSWFIFPLIFFSKMINNERTLDSVGLSILLYFVFWAISAFLRYCCSFELISIHIMKQKPKLVFHDQLGYFSVYFFPSEGDNRAYIEIYKQSILHLRKISKVTIYTQEQTKKDIKDALDYKYREEIRRVKEIEDNENKAKENRERDKAMKSTLDNWDGYLTTVGRRDEKIKSLMKK